MRTRTKMDPIPTGHIGVIERKMKTSDQRMEKMMTMKRPISTSMMIYEGYHIDTLHLYYNTFLSFSTSSTQILLPQVMITFTNLLAKRH
jgi:hypothetical protein